MIHWPTATLGDLTSRTRPICYGVLKPGPHVPGGVPLLRIVDIKANSVDPSEVHLISQELDAEFARSRLLGGEVLLSIQGTIGRVAICPQELAGANISRTIAVIDPDARIDKGFLRFYLLYLASAQRFEVTGTTRDSLNISTIRELEVPLPPLDEQRRLVAILEDHLSRLDAASRSLGTSLKLRNGLWASQVDGAFQLVESGGAAWPCVEIGSVAEFVRGVTYKKPEASSEPGKDRVALLTASNIANDSLDFGNTVYVPTARVDPRQLCRTGDIVIATSSGSSSVVGKSALVREDRQVTFGAFCGLLRPTPSVDSRFLAHIVQSRAVRSKWSALARGTNINNLKATQISATVIPLPPLAIQRQLGDTLDEARGQLVRLEHQLSVALASGSALRRSILQAAFSGQLTRESLSV